MPTKAELEAMLKEANARLKTYESQPDESPEGSFDTKDVEFPADEIPVSFHSAAGNRFTFITGALSSQQIGMIRGGGHELVLMLMPIKKEAEAEK